MAAVFRMAQRLPFLPQVGLLLWSPEALFAALAAICLFAGALIPAPPAIDGAPSTGWTAQTAS